MIGFFDRFSRNREHGWAPFVWLVYSGFFFVQPIMDHVGRKQWLLDLLGFSVFLLLYAGLFLLQHPRGLLHIAGMVALGMIFIPWNGGASTFFIFAAAFTPFVMETQTKAIAGMLTIVAIAATEGWRLHLSRWELFYSAVFPLVVGGGNLFFAERNRMNRKLRKADEEIEHLAKVAERERIARDLHDVLGHTLSVITLKSELAGKLIDHDPERAKAEMADVEQTSRAALADVRSTIRGYRAHSLEAELKQARATLETAGVIVRAESEEVRLTPAQESVVALVVREAVTNVVRHARAHNCYLRLIPVNGNCRIEIQDDGRGGGAVEGNGLRGMRERIEALGGTLERENSAGTRLSIEFPLTPKANVDH